MQRRRKFKGRAAAKVLKEPAMGWLVTVRRLLTVPSVSATTVGASGEEVATATRGAHGGAQQQIGTILRGKAAPGAIAAMHIVRTVALEEVDGDGTDSRNQVINMFNGTLGKVVTRRSGRSLR
mmetsp:Transcript_19752/g.54378  ORF Transcript_19752/g.54378 Transcript_19752/m.54378 type:complete len:123 (-) Transcript_19752:24-392(-)